ncbi:hypothetical protein ACF0H5_022328 [Mactra antiquata]
MRLVVFFLALTVASIYSEECTFNTDCIKTSCRPAFHVICQHLDGAGVIMNGGHCTCAADDLTCCEKEDCVDHSYTCATNLFKHCYDSKCICTPYVV